MKEQNTVYLYANGKTESYAAGFGYTSFKRELIITFSNKIYEDEKLKKTPPVTLLFVEDGLIIAQMTKAELDELITTNNL